MNNTNIMEVECIIYTGVILEKLSWIKYICYVKSKILKGIVIMYKAQNYKMLYVACIICIYIYIYIYHYMLLSTHSHDP